MWLHPSLALAYLAFHALPLLDTAAGELATALWEDGTTPHYRVCTSPGKHTRADPFVGTHRGAGPEVKSGVGELSVFCQSCFK